MKLKKKILTDDIASYCLPIPNNEKWYKFGWEGNKAGHKRMLALFEWIQKLQSNESGQTGDNITILLFTHSGTIANISNRLTTHAVNGIMIMTIIRQIIRRVKKRNRLL